jgi:RNA polymerase sigma factor (sigma-70 family)
MILNNESRTSWLVSALERYEASLVRYATAILGDRDRARDVVQDTFLRLCEEQPARIDGHLAQWLFTVCRNRALDHLRRDRRSTPWAIGEADLGGRQVPPAVEPENQEVLGQILQLVALLPASQREVVLLKFQCDLSYNEISQITGLSVTNVGFLIHTGLKTVRNKLDRAGNERPHPIRRFR